MNGKEVDQSTITQEELDNFLKALKKDISLYWIKILQCPRGPILPTFLYTGKLRQVFKCTCLFFSCTCLVCSSSVVSTQVL